MRNRPISKLICGDCLEVLPTLSAESVHAIVTDPPYGLEFMGKEWDRLGGGRTSKPGIGDRKTEWPNARGWNEQRCTNCGHLPHGGSPCQCDKPEFRVADDRWLRMQAWHQRWAEAALRVAKPGAFLLAFGGTRTFHRLTCALEDAGWEIRDCVMWLYGSGFPKSLDVGKAIDKAAGVEREVAGPKSDPRYQSPRNTPVFSRRGDWGGSAGAGSPVDTAPATDAAKQWDGWGTALKPAWEPIIVARKPLDGSVANNVLKHGCGGLNVVGCRVLGQPESTRFDPSKHSHEGYRMNATGAECARRAEQTQGRWPANVVHDGSDEVVEGFPVTKSGKCPDGYVGKYRAEIYGKYAHNQIDPTTVYGDSGSAARFFYCAKASRSERGAGNKHPTVKPVALMSWLVTLVTPPGGTVLDPFAGSGSTGLTCAKLGLDFIGIELDATYVAMARKRISEQCGLLIKSDVT